MPGEILAVIGDNGAGKSTLIKAMSGAVMPDEGEIRLDGKPIALHLAAARRAAPGSRRSTRTSRCRRRCRSPTTCSWAASCASRASWAGCFASSTAPAMEKFAREKLTELGLMTIQNINQAVETLSGGQRQGVAVARAAAFGSQGGHPRRADGGARRQGKPQGAGADPATCASRGMPIILISHNMPHVFEVADRIHIHRLGQAALRDQPEGLHDVRRGGLHDRRQGAAGRGAGNRLNRRRCGAARAAPAPPVSPAPPGSSARHWPDRRQA